MCKQCMLEIEREDKEIKEVLKVLEGSKELGKDSIVATSIVKSLKLTLVENGEEMARHEISMLVNPHLYE